LCQLHAQRATLAIWRLLRTQQEQSREPHQPVARAVPEPARVAAPNAPHAPVAVQPEPVSHQANPPLVEATLALSEPAGPPLTPALAEPAVGAVVPLVQSQPPAAELHPLFPPHSGAVAAATRADGPAYDAPPLVPPATQQPEPVNPWIVPPLAPPANGSA
jgi:hypothetical protein